jgi:DNA ligase (NAD+)
MLTFNPEQTKLIENSTLSKEAISELIFNPILAEGYDIEHLMPVLTLANDTYRIGSPLFSDTDYDFKLLAALTALDPNHPYLDKVEEEAEDGFEGKTVKLPQRMLSTDKAYTHDEINKWLKRIIKSSSELGIDASTLTIRVTPKLDGFAMYDDGKKGYTRGNGYKGTDITRVFERGLQLPENSSRGLGAGEIVVNVKYFDDYLAGHFDNTRNMISSVIKEKEFNEHVSRAVHDGGVIFHPFASLPSWEGNIEKLKEEFKEITQNIWTVMPFDVDGVILEVTHEDIKAHMGATNKFHRWQIALKANDETAEVPVLSITPQTSKNGRICPVAELEPTRLSDAVLTRATAHHYGRVRNEGLGKGAIIELVRSGLVIPKIQKVIKSVEPDIPTQCPSCNSDVEWIDDNLFCTNTVNCPAQIENTIRHFFFTLGNVDGFGASTISKLHEKGIATVSEIYQLTVDKLVAKDFGLKTAQNLINELDRSRNEPVEDWRFLASFGIKRLGRGSSEKLLAEIPLRQLPSATVEQITAIKGFAKVSAMAILSGLSQLGDQFEMLCNLGFNLEITPLSSEREAIESPIANKVVVFTGTMVQGVRSDMETQAKALGAKVGKSVTGKTDYLVIGEKVGASKTNKAESISSCNIITEAQYIDLISD